MLGSAAASPVAVSRCWHSPRSLRGLPRRVSEVADPPRAWGYADGRRRSSTGLRPAGSTCARPTTNWACCTQALKPNRQSTSLFEVTAVMIGFLLALTAMLLTVPERRRFVAELRKQGYDPRQIVLLLGLQALTLGVVASLIGVGLGDVLSRALFQRAPDFLSAAFPIGTEQVVHAGTVLLALACGVLATALASAAPLLDLRAEPSHRHRRPRCLGHQRDRLAAHDRKAGTSPAWR